MKLVVIETTNHQTRYLPVTVTGKFQRLKRLGTNFFTSSNCQGSVKLPSKNSLPEARRESNSFPPINYSILQELKESVEATTNGEVVIIPEKYENLWDDNEKIY